MFVLQRSHGCLENPASAASTEATSSHKQSQGSKGQGLASAEARVNPAAAASLSAANWQRNAIREPQGFEDHRSFRRSFSFGCKIRADDGSYLDGAYFQVSDGQLFCSSRSKKLDDEPALWPLRGKQR